MLPVVDFPPLVCPEGAPANGVGIDNVPPDCQIDIDTPTPTPSATATDTAYKIRFSNELSLTASSWTVSEIAQIEAAVQNVGEALQIQLSASSPQDAFNRVMVNNDLPEYVYFYRADGSSATVNIQYLPDGPSVQTVQVTIGGCQTFNSLPRVVVCNWGDQAGQYASFPEHAIVHGLGHVFTNRSRYTPTPPPPPDPTPTPNVNERDRGLLFAAIQNTQTGGCSISFNVPSLFQSTQFPSECKRILDLRGTSGLIMGLDSDNEWQRGKRGWGSGPDSIFMEFQQHPQGVFPNDFIPANVDIGIDETAADMFLNWVYRRRSNNPPSYQENIPGAWQGFRNTSWSVNPAIDDDNYPGDARFEWMNIVMGRIMFLKGW